MISRKCLFAMSVSVAGLLLTPVAAAAQDTSAPVTSAAAPQRGDAARESGKTSLDAGDIVVTARKRQENITDTPLAISAFTGDTLQDRGVPNIHQLDTVTPSLTVTNFGAGNVSDVSIFIRGIGVADHLILTDPSVGVYIDGVYLGRSMGANLGLMNIDHVEVLRGPQGTLSGRNTLGGAVNVVTKEPNQTEHYEFSGSLATRLHANVGFYGNTPITDTLAISLTGSFEHRDGIGRFINLPGEDTKVGQIDKGAARFAMKWQPTSDASLLLAVDGSSGHYGLSPMKNTIINPAGSFGLTPALLPANENDNGTTNPNIPNTSSRDLGVALTGNLRLDEHLTLKVIGSERYSSYKGGLDDDDSPLRASEFPETGYARQYSAEATLGGEYGRFDFVTGVYAFREKGNARQPNYIFGGNPGQFFLDQTTRSVAGYAHAGFALTDALKVSGGLRYTDDRKRASAFIGCCLNPGVTRRASWNAVTWDAAIDYTFRPALSGYATIQHGYLSGGFPARPFGGAATFVAYNPTYATNYEVGLKGRLGDVLRFSSALFYTQYKDLALQFNQVTSQGFVTLTANAGRSRTYGVEFEGELRATDIFSINGSASYNNALVTKVAAGVVGVVEGDVPQLTPKWTASLGPQVRVPLASGAIATARIDTSYRSSMFGQSANNPFNYIKPRYLTSFNLSYELPDRGLTLSIYGNNIFNEVYDTSRVDQFSAGFVEAIRSNDRSEFGVRIRKKF